MSDLRSKLGSSLCEIFSSYGSSAFFIWRVKTFLLYLECVLVIINKSVLLIGGESISHVLIGQLTRLSSSSKGFHIWYYHPRVMPVAFKTMLIYVLEIWIQSLECRRGSSPGIWPNISILSILRILIMICTHSCIILFLWINEEKNVLLGTTRMYLFRHDQTLFSDPWLTSEVKNSVYSVTILKKYCQNSVTTLFNY